MSIFIFATDDSRWSSKYIGVYYAAPESQFKDVFGSVNNTEFSKAIVKRSNKTFMLQICLSMVLWIGFTAATGMSVFWTPLPLIVLVCAAWIFREKSNKKSLGADLWRNFKADTDYKNVIHQLQSSNRSCHIPLDGRGGEVESLSEKYHSSRDARYRGEDKDTYGVIYWEALERAILEIAEEKGHKSKPISEYLFMMLIFGSSDKNLKELVDEYIIHVTGAMLDYQESFEDARFIAEDCLYLILERIELDSLDQEHDERVKRLARDSIRMNRDSHWIEWYEW